MTGFDPLRSFKVTYGRYSFSWRYPAAMKRLALLAALIPAACSTDNVPAPTTRAEVRPVVATDSLQGRWTFTAVNGKHGNGLWLELGGEGLTTVTKIGNSILVESPSTPTRAYLGCNDWHPGGWTRIGDKLTLGREMSRRTERGCDAATMALDDEAYAILNETMTMELTPPNRLRLINSIGTLDLVRDGR